MQLFSLLTNQFYPIINIYLPDVNKILSWQKYNVIRRRGDKKDKNRNLCKTQLEYSKENVYKDKKQTIKKKAGKEISVYKLSIKSVYKQKKLRIVYIDKKS